MIEILDEINSLEIKGEGTKRIMIFCDILERFEYGIIGFKTRKGLFFDSREQVLVIHTDVERTKVDNPPKEADIVSKAEFNSIKEVLDSFGIKINWRALC